MNALTNIQILKNENGTPQYVVIPYADYLMLTGTKPVNIDTGVPSEVVNMVFDRNYSPIKAWREYLGLSQIDVAKKIGVSQSAYSQYEKSANLRKATVAKIATALNIKPEQLEF